MKGRTRVRFDLRGRNQPEIHRDTEPAGEILARRFERAHKRKPRVTPHAVGENRIVRHLEAGDIRNSPPAVLKPKGRPFIGRKRPKKLGPTERQGIPEFVVVCESRDSDAAFVERHVVRAQHDHLHFFVVLTIPVHVLQETELA